MGNVLEKFEKVKACIFDVDGVLTDGTVQVTTSGEQWRTFFVKDGLAIVKAIDQGHFTLETNINDILPFEVKNPKVPDAVITVKHLVTHTAGLLDEYEAYLKSYAIVPGEDLSTDGAQLLIEGLGVQMRTPKPLGDFLAAYYLPNGDLYSADNFAATSPGATWNYSNIATSLSAYLVEVATGVPFKTYLTTNILQPLDMSNTAYNIVDLDATHMAKLYWDKDTPLPKYSNDSYPDAGINTSNQDLTKYLIDMMKGARGQSTALFSQAGYEMLFETLLSDGQLPAVLGENQGVFWFLAGDQISHSGSDPGTTCNLQFDKNSNTGYLFLTNMDASTDEHEAAYFEVATEVQEVISAFLQNN